MTYPAQKPRAASEPTMILPLFRRNRRVDTISALYGTIVAQARRPCFYQDFAVPDTINGRFDLLVLHLVLVIERLNAEEGLRALAQGLFDRFCQDIDYNFREMGVGDLAVPKEMRKVAEAFYGRTKAYEAALASTDTQALELTVARNVFGASEPILGARRLAAYMRQAAQMLGQWDLAAGRELHFPDPQALPEPALG